MLYQRFADLVLLAHFGVVVFVLGGLLAIVAGNVFGAAWVNRPLFRWAHLAAIGFVVLQSWLGATCPLTTLENWLRTQAGQPAYEASFVEHWVSVVLFYQAPSWVFAAVYTLFGLAVVAAWWRWPPIPSAQAPTAERGA
jgi:hypothetical protein